MSSIKNIVMLVIMQVGVIVAGVLAAGICHKSFAIRGLAVPFSATMVYSYGVLGLLIPLAWGTAAVALQLRPGVSEDLKTLILWSGILLLISMGAFAIYADVMPWLHVLMTTGSGSGINDGD